MVMIRDVLSGGVDEKKVLVRGWLQNKRSSGGIIFLAVRDGSGVVQCT
ncbi:asparagine--tRNA ligase, partial [Candidatus Bathyarchaeota archaeon]|nr:asparagine--tRNA ligase [Candidatus Bathyarchaeota archaeon]